MGNCCGQQQVLDSYANQIVFKVQCDDQLAHKAAIKIQGTMVQNIQACVKGYLLRKQLKSIKTNSIAVAGTQEYSYSNKPCNNLILFTDPQKMAQQSKETEVYKQRHLIDKIPQHLIELTKSIKDKFPPFEYEDVQYPYSLTTIGPVNDGVDNYYQGQWKDNLKWGKGIQYYADGSYYEGGWKNNKQHGKGRLIHVEGDVYEGEWSNDKASGFGTLTTQDGGKYVGQWSHDKQHGHGKEFWPDGATFEGNYIDGKKNGQGTYKAANGSQYKGNFIDNTFNGFGEYTWIDGNSYKGYWKNNKMNGEGEFVWSDGSKYIGEFFNDLRHGQGTFYYADGRTFKGQWKAGKKNGQGVYVGKNQVEKIGEWKEGSIVIWTKQYTNQSCGEDSKFH